MMRDEIIDVKELCRRTGYRKSRMHQIVQKAPSPQVRFRLTPTGKWLVYYEAFLEWAAGNGKGGLNA